MLGILGRAFMCMSSQVDPGVVIRRFLLDRRAWTVRRTSLVSLDFLKQLPVDVLCRVQDASGPNQTAGACCVEVANLLQVGDRAFTWSLHMCVMAAQMICFQA